jgi:hypothetical protein
MKNTLVVSMSIRQTENTGINEPGIMGKMSDTWRGVKTSIKTGETDQGVTLPLLCHQQT